MFFVFAAGILLAVSAISVLAYIFPMFSMHPLASGIIEGTDITAIKNRINNLFFIPSDKGWIVVDAGSDARSVKQEMEKWSIEGDKVKGVFLTHTDYDHVASLVLFPDAAIYMSEREKQMIDGSTRRQFIKKNRLPRLGENNRIIWLRDNEIVDLCNHQVRMIPAQGHTRGSALYAVDEKYLFTGDAFKEENGQILIHPYTMDRKTAQETIHGMKDEFKKYEKVFTAHYGLIRNDKK